MKFFVLLFVQLLIVHVAWGALSKVQDSRNPDHPGKCYYKGKESPTILSPGETVSIKGACARASCGADFSMEFTTCGTVNGPKEYYKPGDLSLPYPDCCPTYSST